MATINLLPWREELREKRNREFKAALLLTGLFAALAVFLAWILIDSVLRDYQSAVQYIQEKQQSVDQQVKDLDGLEERRAQVIIRMEAVHKLQKSRSVLARIMDELARAIPSDLYLISLKRTNDRLTMVGYAQSPTTVSELTRRLDISPWFQTATMTYFTAEDLNKAKDKPVSLLPRPEDSYGKFEVTAELADPEILAAGHSVVPAGVASVNQSAASAAQAKGATP